MDAIKLGYFFIVLLGCLLVLWLSTYYHTMKWLIGGFLVFETGRSIYHCQYWWATIMFLGAVWWFWQAITASTTRKRIKQNEGGWEQWLK